MTKAYILIHGRKESKKYAILKHPIVNMKIYFNS